MLEGGEESVRSIVSIVDLAASALTGLLPTGGSTASSGSRNRVLRYRLGVGRAEVEAMGPGDARGAEGRLRIERTMPVEGTREGPAAGGSGEELQ